MDHDQVAALVAGSGKRLDDGLDWPAVLDELVRRPVDLTAACVLLRGQPPSAAAKLQFLALALSVSAAS